MNATPRSKHAVPECTTVTIHLVGGLSRAAVESFYVEACSALGLRGSTLRDSGTVRFIPWDSIEYVTWERRADPTSDGYVEPEERRRQDAERRTNGRTVRQPIIDLDVQEPTPEERAQALADEAAWDVQR